MKKIVISILFAGAVAWISCGGTANQSNPLHSKEKVKKTIPLTKDDFLKKVVDYKTNSNEWKYLGDKPAIIDFYADWCGPCKLLAPVLENLAAEYGDRIYIYKVDVDREKELATVFGITAIPLLLFIPMDRDPQMARGALPKASIKKLIEDVLLSAPR